MPAHKHAELMMQYAQDALETDKPWERWEVKTCEQGGWYTPTSQVPFNEWNEYRRKPKTINVNGHEAPEYDDYIWEDTSLDTEAMKRGLIHLTKEAAIAHAKALLSFTEKKESDDE